MSEYRRQIVTGGVVAAIIAIIAVAGAVYLPLNTTTTSTASTPYTTQHNFPSTYTSSSTNGPQLQININTSQIEYGSHLSVKIELYNPSSDSVTLNTDYSNDQTILNWNTNDFLCSLGQVNDLFSFALYQGYYTSQNFSIASKQLVLAPNAAIPCPTTFQPNISKVTIAPGSDSANFSNGNPLNLEINATTQSCQTQGSVSSCGQGTSLYGYWTTPPANENCSQVSSANQSYPFGYAGPNCNLVSFPVGTYTLVSQDLWNHTVYAYFQVVNSPTMCPSGQALSNGFVINAGTSSPTTLCVQLYYYSPSSALTLNLSNALSIQALYYVWNGSIGNPISFNGATNFTITSSQKSLVIGGPTNENEGTVVAFSITAKSGASGTYQLGFFGPNSQDSIHGSVWLLGSSEPLQCGYYGQLVAGNGQPMYAQPTGCITTSGSNSAGYHTLSGISYQLLDGNLYFRLVGGSQNSELACSTNFSNGTSIGTALYLDQSSGSTARLCVRYYYYNTTAPITINALQQLTIYAPVPSSGTLRNTDSSFLISANVSQIQIGGPQLENEGAMIVYTIKSTGAAPTGTYEIGLSSGLYPKDIICGWGIYINLQVGNATNPTVVTFCHYVPPPENNSGLIYSEIVGVSNSTT